MAVVFSTIRRVNGVDTSRRARFLIVTIASLLAVGCSPLGSRHSSVIDSSSVQSTDWHQADVCAGVSPTQLKPLAEDVLHATSIRELDRAGCVYVDNSGKERVSAFLVYIGYDPRDIVLLSASGQDIPNQAWIRNEQVAGHPALVVEESSATCQVLVPLTGEQEGWGVRISLTPLPLLPQPQPQPQPQAHGAMCSVGSSVVTAFVAGLPNSLLTARDSSLDESPSHSPELRDACTVMLSTQIRASALLVPLLDVVSKPSSAHTGTDILISAPAAAQGLLQISTTAQRLAARHVPFAVHTELTLLAHNAERFRELLQDPQHSNADYLHHALALRVNHAKLESLCPQV